ncbi:hypothetical protein OF83DRAFT_1175875 [Amylostereum chailletii]|nr:hypothetical protein OF83DRAFT_1175875 [Amylostereum chailletii]
MKTCRTLYFSGIPIQLNHPVIEAETSHSFCKFIIGQAPRSFFFLRDMTFDLALIPLSGKQASHVTHSQFIQVLSGAVYLKALTLNGGEVFLSENPALANAVCALSKLSELTIVLPKDNPQFCTTFLSKIQAPLKMLDVAFDGFDHLDDDPEEDLNPLEIISPLRHTLEDLAVRMIDIGSVDIAFPMVTSLRANITSIALTRTLKDVFPNLLHLNAQTTPFEVYPRLEEMRTWRSRKSLTPRAEVWPCLDTLSSDPLSLYALGVDCKVRYLEVKGSVTCTQEALADWRTVLTDASPTCLTFNVLKDGFEAHHIAELLPPSLSLTHLKIGISLTTKPSVIADEVFDALYRLLRSMRLEDLFLSCSCQEDIGLDELYIQEFGVDVDQRPMSRNVAFVAGLDGETVTRNILAAMPTLRHFILETRHRRNQEWEKSVWKVNVVESSGDDRSFMLSEERGFQRAAGV